MSKDWRKYFSSNLGLGGSQWSEVVCVAWGGIRLWEVYQGVDPEKDTQSARFHKVCTTRMNTQRLDNKHFCTGSPVYIHLLWSNLLLIHLYRWCHLMCTIAPSYCFVLPNMPRKHCQWQNRPTERFQPDKQNSRWGTRSFLPLAMF